MIAMTFGVLNRKVRIIVDRSVQTQWVVTLLSGFSHCDHENGGNDLIYRITEDFPGRLSIFRGGELLCHTAANEECVFLLKQALVVDMQRLRSDLLFLHAAVLEREGVATLFVASSGFGKSTICWSLLHHGFRYMSDELAPIDVQAMRVAPFPLAITLKSDPVSRYRTPDDTVHTTGASYIPVQSLPAAAVQQAMRIACVVFVEYSPAIDEPSITLVSAAEAAVRLYANTLNGKAHVSLGIDQAIAISRTVPCAYLRSKGMEETAALFSSFYSSSIEAPWHGS